MLVIRRLLAPLAVCIFVANVAVAEPMTVGAVDKVQAHVEATQAGQSRALVVKSEIYFRDRCHSTEGARLQATLKDGTQLTLDENATLWSTNLSMTRPCRVARFRSALSEERSYTLGVGSKGWTGRTCRCARQSGRYVWGGPIDKDYGVVVLSGEVTMIGRKATVTL